MSGQQKAALPTAIFGAIFGLVLFVGHTTYAAAPLSPHPIQYWCLPYMQTFVEGGYYLHAGNGCTYVVRDVPAGGIRYGEILRGTIGSSTVVNGHLFFGDNDNVANYDLPGDAQQGEDFITLISDGDVAIENYFLHGGPPPGNENYGFIRWKYGVAPPPPSCTENCYSSVLFLPGIESSRLYRPDYVGGIDKLWEPGHSEDVKDLFLDAEGNSVRNDIYTKEGDAIDEIFPGTNIYKSFLTDLDNWKNSENLISDYSVVAYDWRLSLDDLLNYGNKIEDRIYYSGDFRATSTPYIRQELERLAVSSRSGKVTIIAHSNGGLVAKALIKRLQETNDPLLGKIDTLVLIAVPQTGTPQALGAALHGFGQALPHEWFSVILDPETARAFASTSPMTYHLLPSAGYTSGEGSTVQTPVITFKDGEITHQFIDTYGHTIDTAPKLHDFLLGNEGRYQPAENDLKDPIILSPALLEYGETTHASLDNLTPPSSIDVHQVAGWGLETLSGIEYSTGYKCTRRSILFKCLELQPQLLYSPNMVVDGDETVIVPSALLMSTSLQNISRLWVDLEEYNASHIDRDHKNLLEVGELRTFVRENLLKKMANPLPQFLTSSSPTPAPTDTRLHFILHSPLDLSAKDVFGNEISANTSNVNGALYKRFGEVQFISIPSRAHPTLQLTGNDEGSFTLEVKELIGGNIVATTSFTGIPSGTSTKATMNFPDGTLANASPLLIDQDGDGSVDATFEPSVGEVVLPQIDVTPPEAIISVSTTTKDVEVVGIDDALLTTVTYDGDTVTIADEAGNETHLRILKTFSKNNLTYVRIRDIQYGTSTPIDLPSAFLYVWNTKNTPATLISQTITVDKQFAIEALYNAKRDITTIIVFKKKMPIKKVTVSGLAVIKLTTDKGAVNYSW